MVSVIFCLFIAISKFQLPNRFVLINRFSFLPVIDHLLLASKISMIMSISWMIAIFLIMMIHGNLEDCYHVFLMYSYVNYLLMDDSTGGS
jgi:hypothetical protein